METFKKVKSAGLATNGMWWLKTKVVVEKNAEIFCFGADQMKTLLAKM